MVLLRLVYGDLIDKKFDEFREWWNTHSMRMTPANPDSPSGRPDQLFFAPEVHERRDDGTLARAYGHPVDTADVRVCRDFLAEYAGDRKEPGPSVIGTRITRADLFIPETSVLVEILGELATPTMSNAQSIYKVALFMFDHRQVEMSQASSSSQSAKRPRLNSAPSSE